MNTTASILSNGKYRVTSKTEIKTNRSVTFKKLVDEFGANNVKNKRAGWFVYEMTAKALDLFVKTCEVEFINTYM